jgi:Cellulase (glycosyl hydrolase family 5)
MKEHDREGEGTMWKRRLALRLVGIILAASVLLVALRVAAVRPQAARDAMTTPSKAGWTTQGIDILTPAGKPYIIAGVSWYGLETPQHVLYGLDTQEYKTILDETKTYQFNTLRIPFSNEVWETNPLPSPQLTHACGACQGLRARDILALVINYAGSIGLHVILDDHRSGAGSSTATNGLWYDTDGGLSYTEQVWIRDWVDVQRWVHGQQIGLGPSDTVRVSDTASDGFPTVIGYDLRNEPHTPPAASYLQGATWGTGDGIGPRVNPNPNPFTPACVVTSTCHDWRLAAERAGDTILGDAASHGWGAPLIFVQGISNYPSATGSALKGPYDLYRWGGQLQGVNGNANNPGAPIVFNAGGTSSRLGPAVAHQLVYVTRDYGPDISPTAWFTSTTCYQLGCASHGSLSGLVDLWCQRWAYIDLPPGRYGACTGGIQPHFWTAQTWNNTGAVPYTQAPVWIGEFGTGNGATDLNSPVPGSQGQWFTDLINFIQSSYLRTRSNDPGLPVQSLNWTYWALNADDSYALLGGQFTGLANPSKQYSFLCFIERSPPSRTHLPHPCGSTGMLPPPH